MNKKEKRIVKIVEREIIRFIRDWQKSPFEWNRERDIQLEIASRINTALRKNELHILRLKYKCVRLPKYKNKPQVYNRLCCEEITYYKDKDGKKKECYPDIIVYKDWRWINNPPNNDDKKKINFPMLLVCEIKYKTESYSDIPKKHKKFDEKKLNALVKQMNDKKIYGAEYGCSLNFERDKELNEAFRNVILKKGQCVSFIVKPLPLRKR